jgi:hypothetical protein
MAQGNKRPASPWPTPAAQPPDAFSILMSVNKFIGASSVRSTTRASGRESIQFPTAE